MKKHNSVTWQVFKNAGQTRFGRIIVGVQRQKGCAGKQLH